MTGLNLFFCIIPLFSYAQAPSKFDQQAKENSILKCIKWFNKGKIDINSKNCEIECAILKVGLANFNCPSLCRNFCKVKYTSSSLGTFIYYPGLTVAEEILAKNHPLEALIVFVQKTKAESASMRNFPDQGFNDESDAFRHFVWAAFLTKELGANRANVYLDAHETAPRQPKIQRAMDLANNRAGVIAAQELMKKGRWSQKAVEQAALDSLRSGRLVVLNPGLVIPKTPK